ncbi:MAG: hypothetical protein KDD50_14405 [Bdellovibrionales bacterium]|nr:hypothetical protein [Bdellovibrionales bacterium]
MRGLFFIVFLFVSIQTRADVHPIGSLFSIDGSVLPNKYEVKSMQADNDDDIRVALFDENGREIIPDPEKPSIKHQTKLEKIVPEAWHDVAEDFGFDLEQMGLYAELYIYKSILGGLEMSEMAGANEYVSAIPAPVLIAYESYLWYKSDKTGKGLKRFLPPGVKYLLTNEHTPKFYMEKIMSQIQKLKDAHEYINSKYGVELAEAAEVEKEKVSKQLEEKRASLKGLDAKSRAYEEITAVISQLEEKMRNVKAGNWLLVSSPLVEKIQDKMGEARETLKMRLAKRVSLEVSRGLSLVARYIGKGVVGGLGKGAIIGGVPVAVLGLTSVDVSWIVLRIKDGKTKAETIKEISDIVAEIEGQLGIYQ